MPYQNAVFCWQKINTKLNKGVLMPGCAEIWWVGNPQMYPPQKKLDPGSIFGSFAPATVSFFGQLFPPF